MDAISINVIFQSTNSILTKGVLRGGGDTRFLMIADILFLWVLSIPLGAAAGLLWNWSPFVIYLCLRSDQIVKAIWCIFRLKSGKWIKKIKVVNMLGCHDGIPLLDLKGLLPENEINSLIDVIVGRGGYVKNLHGQKNIYYQVNATYYSALGENEPKMLLARAIQLFMPGKPQVWYLDLFAGKNNHEAVVKAGAGGHKEINRTNLTKNDINKALKLDIVKKQLKLLQLRNSFPAFGYDAIMSFSKPTGMTFSITWRNNDCSAKLNVDLADFGFEIILNNKKSLTETVFKL